MWTDKKHRKRMDQVDLERIREVLDRAQKAKSPTVILRREDLEVLLMDSVIQERELLNLQGRYVDWMWLIIQANGRLHPNTVIGPIGPSRP